MDVVEQSAKLLKIVGPSSGRTFCRIEGPWFHVPECTPVAFSVTYSDEVDSNGHPVFAIVDCEFTSER